MKKPSVPFWILYILSRDSIKSEIRMKWSQQEQALDSLDKQFCRPGYLEFAKRRGSLNSLFYFTTVRYRFYGEPPSLPKSVIYH